MITFPWVAISLYWILGKNEFFEYAQALQNAYLEKHNLVSQAYGKLLKYKVILPDKLSSIEKLTEVFTPLPFTSGNELKLLVDGQQTYAAMLKAIAIAQDYILLQSYIINNDRTGNEFRQALIDKANQGIRVNRSPHGFGDYRCAPHHGIREQERIPSVSRGQER